MLSKQRAKKLIRNLSEEEFDIFLSLLLRPLNVCVPLLRNEACSLPLRLVICGLWDDLRHGGFRLLEAIFERLERRD